MIDLQARFTNAMQKKRLAHALLFLGANGPLKEETALNLFAGILCEQQIIPYGCQNCHSCKQVREKRHPRVRLLTLESENSSEIKVDQIRDLISTPGNPSWIIPEAHLLNKQASNALLKTLEEPRLGQFFILIAPATRSLLPTLVSRCQRVFFSRAEQEALEKTSLEIPQSLLERIELIERLIKEKTDLSHLLTQWENGASYEFKEALLKARENLKKHMNAQLILESLLLSNKD